MKDGQAEQQADRSMHEAFKIDEAKVASHVDRVVRELVVSTLTLN